MKGRQSLEFLLPTKVDDFTRSEPSFSLSLSPINNSFIKSQSVSLSFQSSLSFTGSQPASQPAMSPEKEQVTVMILYVDLKCSCCYKKVRKLLCKFPQIRDQVFDEEKNKVTITVVCCDPERMRDKLCCKGGKAIQSIEILDPPKPQPPPPKPKPQTPPAPKPAADPPKVPDPLPPPPQPKLPDPLPPPPQPKLPDPPQPKMPDPLPPPQPKMPDPKPPPPQPKMPDPKPPPPQPKMPDPIPQPKMPDPIPQPKMPDPLPPPQPDPVPIAMNPCWPPVSVCCQECYEGRGGGPCYYGYGRPVPPPPGPCYDGYGYHYGYRAPCYVTRCDYFSEENPQGCSIM